MLPFTISSCSNDGFSGFTKLFESSLSILLQEAVDDYESISVIGLLQSLEILWIEGSRMSGVGHALKVRSGEGGSRREGS